MPKIPRKFDEKISKIGIICSFPGDSRITPYGVDLVPALKLTKDWEVSGRDDEWCVGKDLCDGLKLSGLIESNIKIYVMNDTTALLGRADIALVDGTGLNIALWDQKGEGINLEAGGFRSLTLSELFYGCSLNTRIDAGTVNYGRQLLEKMVTINYLREEFIQMIHELVKNKFLVSIPNLKGKVTFKLIDSIIRNEKDIVQLKLSINDEQYSLLREGLIRLTNRSADCLAAVLAGISRFYNRELNCATEGGTYHSTPGYSERVKLTLSNLSPLKVNFIGSGERLGMTNLAHFLQNH